MSEAENANNEISQNMSLSGNITSVWDIPIATLDGKFGINKPENRFLTNVYGYTEVEQIF